MRLKLYQIDAFTEKLFCGNPAAIVPLEKWLDDSLMQQIGMENNLAETAFFVPKGKEDFDIRWFTPALEINLCGHATLGSAYILFNKLGYKGEKIVCHSKSGPLTVTRKGDELLMDFPSWKPVRITEDTDSTDLLLTSLGKPVVAGIYKNRDYLIELEDEEAVLKLNPDFALMKKAGKMVIVTAPGKEADFVSRFFAPNAGIDEDPVTGSAHSQLIPFWSEKLGKDKMRARQLSKRGGDVYCEQRGNRVIMGGKCVFYSEGEITL
jgi:PhzF family phenazine biosynthesis protein